MPIDVVICVDPFPDTPVPSVNFPGIGALRAMKAKLDQAPSPYELAATLIQQASPVLAPIMQILRVIELVLAIVDTLKAVKSPTKIVRKIKALVKKLAVITAFLPGLPYVRLGRDILDLLSAILHGFVSLIERWITELALIANALTSRSVLLEDTELPELVICSKLHLNAAIGGSVNTLGDLAGVGNILARLFELLKNFLPTSVAKNIAEIFIRLALIPPQLLNVRTAITAAESGDEVAVVIVELRRIQSSIDEVADRLDSLSATISTFLP